MAFQEHAGEPVMGRISPPAAKVVFRVDASQLMGTGHVMRCLTLARVLSSKGAKCFFLSRSHKGNLIDHIKSQGHWVHSLEGSLTHEPYSSYDEQPTHLQESLNISQLAHSEWLGVSQQEDIKACLPILEKISPDWLIVDHYGLDNRWEAVARSVAHNLMAIDDLADRVHDCDLLLDQNWFSGNLADRYKHKIPAHCKTLLGPTYALLAREYSKFRGSLAKRDGTVNNVLVFLGGSDATNQTLKVVEALSTHSLQHLRVDVVIGPNHPDPEGVQRKCCSRPLTTLHQNLPSLANLMAKSDLMIGAGGATTWERMCLGLPSLVISIAENQVSTNVALMNAGYISFLGPMDDVGIADIEVEILQSIESPEKLRAQSAQCAKLTQGSGALQVCDQILS